LARLITTVSLQLQQHYATVHSESFKCQQFGNFLIHT